MMRCWALLLCVMSLHAHALSHLSITAESITHDGVTLSNAKANLDLKGQDQVTVEADSLEFGQSRLENPHILLDLKANTTLRISAKGFRVDPFEVRNPLILMDYRKSIVQPTLAITADARGVGDKTWGTLRLHCLIPKGLKDEAWQCADGLYQTERVNVPFIVSLQPQNAGGVASIEVNNAKFTDESGLHAGERLTGQIVLAAQQFQQGWNWQGRFSWKQGELFWQPFYFPDGGKEFEIDGFYQAPNLQVKHAKLQLPGVGSFYTSAGINLDTKAFDHVKVEAKDVDFAGLYQSFIQPMLTQSAFGKLKVSGRADWSFEAQGMQPQKFELNIENANIEDDNGKFGFSNLNAHIPWDYDDPKTMTMGYSGGHLLKIPLGMTNWQAQLDRYSITAPKLELPILDGALSFQDVSAAWINQSMVWHLQMDMKPISMNSFSQALGWPEMRGQIDGKIPLITYANKELNMQGTMQFNMFQGMIGMTELTIQDPLGAVPKLHANLTMREIDLGEITRTFNFGTIEGRLEGDVKELRLQNWKPIYMNAIIQTDDGKHEKKISQRAVENITALGGEGTAAALQRTFLRFFKEFNYEKIGLSCELRGDICKMGGVESTPTGFIIVKGKGVPSVNVNGFTEYVSWKDLLARMQRIVDANSKVIVK
jgi:hypothetical protein